VTTLDFRRKVAAGRLGSLEFTLAVRYRTRVIRDAREGESQGGGKRGGTINWCVQAGTTPVTIVGQSLTVKTMKRKRALAERKPAGHESPLIQ